MRFSPVCTLAFVLAVTKTVIATPVLAFQSQPEKDPSSDSLALGPTTGNDDKTTCGSLRSRDLDQARSKVLMSFREETSTMGPKRSAKVYSHIRSISRSEAGNSLSVFDRSLLTDLAKTGFRLVWDYIDIAYASFIAFHQTTEFWANITANARGKWKAEQEVMTLDISFGSLKLSIAGLIDTIAWELVAEFALEMLVLSRMVVFGAFRVIIFAGWEVMVITLAIAVQVLHTFRPQQLATGP